MKPVGPGAVVGGSPDGGKQGVVTLNDTIDSVISKDFTVRHQHPYQGFEPQAWKLRRALQHKEIDQGQAQAQAHVQTREKNEERNIVRIAGQLSPSSRSRYYSEPVSLSPLDYVKNRIAEVMRTSEEEGGGSGNKSGGGGGGSDSPGGGEMVIDEGEESSQIVQVSQPLPQGPPPAPAFITSSNTYTYPYSALSLSTATGASPVSVPATPKQSSVPPSQPPTSETNPPEPAPLLSAQYEPLSDED